MDVCYGHRSEDNDMQDDLIYRQAAIDHWRSIIDATNEDSIYSMGFVDGLEFCINHLSTMPSAQSEVTEEDVKEYCRKRCLSIVDSALLKKYASAQPEQKKGQWIHKGGGSFICSDCGELVGLNTYRSERAGEIFLYCPHCGADMKGGTIHDRLC